METSAQKFSTETAIVLPKKPSDGLPISPTRAYALRVIGTAALSAASVPGGVRLAQAAYSARVV